VQKQASALNARYKKAMAELALKVLDGEFSEGSNSTRSIHIDQIPRVGKEVIRLTNDAERDMLKVMQSVDAHIGDQMWELALELAKSRLVRPHVEQSEGMGEGVEERVGAGAAPSEQERVGAGAAPSEQELKEVVEKLKANGAYDGLAKWMCNGSADVKRAGAGTPPSEEEIKQIMEKLKGSSPPSEQEIKVMLEKLKGSGARPVYDTLVRLVCT
jgi:hypothetical protein